MTNFSMEPLNNTEHPPQTFDDFYNLLEELHMMTEAKVPFRVSYVDPKDNDLLPINNTDNYLRALQNARPLLRDVILES